MKKIVAVLERRVTSLFAIARKLVKKINGHSRGEITDRAKQAETSML